MLHSLQTPEETVMSATFPPAPILRYALLGDCIASAGMGLLLLVGSSPLSDLLGLSQLLLVSAGLVCLAWGAVTGWISRRTKLSSGTVWTVIILNGLWVIESAALLMSGWASPTTLGTGFVILQALIVLALAEAQFVGLRKSVKTEFVPA
jgi:hypothetical protein